MIIKGQPDGANQSIIKAKWDKKQMDTDPISPSEYKEPTSINCRRKGKHRPKLTVKDKIDIVHRSIIKNHFEKDIAKEFRIT